MRPQRLCKTTFRIHRTLFTTAWTSSSRTQKTSNDPYNLLNIYITIWALELFKGRIQRFQGPLELPQEPIEPPPELLHFFIDPKTSKHPNSLLKYPYNSSKVPYNPFRSPMNILKNPKNPLNDPMNLFNDPYNPHKDHLNHTRTPRATASYLHMTLLNSDDPKNLLKDLDLEQ